jgi:hypothetical protein
MIYLVRRGGVMVLKFFWNRTHGWLLPWCRPVEGSKGQLVGSYLVNDLRFGASGALQTSKKMIEVLDAGMWADVDDHVIPRDGEVAKIADGVMIISAYMDTRSEPDRLRVEDFRRVLVTWQEFILAGPNGDPERHLEVADA